MADGRGGITDARQGTAARRVRYLSRCKKCLQSTPVIGISHRGGEAVQSDERSSLSLHHSKALFVSANGVGEGRRIKGINIPLRVGKRENTSPSPHSDAHPGRQSPASSSPFLLLFYELVNCPFRNAVAASDDAPRSLIDVSLPCPQLARAPLTTPRSLARTDTHILDYLSEGGERWGSAACGLSEWTTPCVDNSQVPHGCIGHSVLQQVELWVPKDLLVLAF